MRNFYEVANVSAALFNLPGLAHVRLIGKLFARPPELPAVIRKAMRKAAGVLHLEVDVAKYGRGRLSLLVLRDPRKDAKKAREARKKKKKKVG